MKFKIDENLPVIIQEILTKAGYSTHTVYDEDIQGIDDQNLIKKTSTEERILVTLDLDFSNITIYPPEKYSGIIVLRPVYQDIKSIVSLIEKILPVLKFEKIKNQLWIVESTRVRIKGSGL